MGLGIHETVGTFAGPLRALHIFWACPDLQYARGFFVPPCFLNSYSLKDTANRGGGDSSVPERDWSRERSKGL